MFPCEFCEIFKNIFFYRTPPVAASWPAAVNRNSLDTQKLFSQRYKNEKERKIIFIIITALLECNTKNLLME